jgi:hypothetical protein
MIVGYGWTWGTELSQRIATDVDIDADLKSVLLTAVAHDPDRRYQSIQEMYAMLASYLEAIWPGRSW